MLLLLLLVSGLWTRLVECVWDEASDVIDNLVDAHVSHLRKMVDRGRRVQLIHTERGFDYRLGLPEEVTGA